jgi:ubiquinone/menaquinone biosynthesis C-methylase UbiE
MRQTSETPHDIGHFEQWSRTYEQSWMQRRIFDPAHAAALDALAATGAAPETLLDIGCGTGRLLRDAHSRWPQTRLIGVDPAKGMIAVARELTPEATLLVGAAEALPLGGASVEVVLSTLSFHHWRDQAAGLREIARVLKPGGRFILVDIYAPGWLGRLFGNPRARDARARHSLFADAGLRIALQRIAPFPFVLLTAAERTAQ